MKNRLIILCCILTISSVNAQNPGYFNRKNVLEFSVNAQSPIFGNISNWIDGNRFNVLSGDMFQKKLDHFDWGFRTAFTHTFRRDLGLGIEFGYDYFSIQRARGSSNWFNGNIHYEKMDATSMMIMPKIEISNKGSVLPMGISHQIGLGVRFVKPVDKPYHYVSSYDYYDPNQGNNEIEIISDTHTVAPVRGLTLMYAVNVRTPLSKRLFLNYGVRYTLNFMSKPESGSWQYLDEYNYQIPAISDDEFKHLVRQRKQYSFIQANIGLSFAF